MHTIVHHRSYLWRYLSAFLGVAMLVFFAPQCLHWPLRSTVIFALFALSLCQKKTIGSALPLKQQGLAIFKIGLWQCFAALDLMALPLLWQRLSLIQPSHEASILHALDGFNPWLLLATFAPMLAYLVSRHRQALTLWPFFPPGANALTPRVIFSNTAFRDACLAIGLVNFCSSLMVLIRLYQPHWRQPTLLLLAFVLTFIAVKAPPSQKYLARLAKRHGFGSTLILISACFIAMLFFSQLIVTHWSFSLPLSLATAHPIDASALFQCVSVIVIVPVIFRTVPYCQGLSLRVAVFSYAANPLLWIFAGLYHHWHEKLMPWLASTLGLTGLASALLALSLLYLNSRWFANVVERLFSNEGDRYHKPLRWFFNKRWQGLMLLWLLATAFGLGAFALILLSAAVIGSVLVYIHCYFFFWERVHEQRQRL